MYKTIARGTVPSPNLPTNHVGVCPIWISMDMIGYDWIYMDMIRYNWISFLKFGYCFDDLSKKDIQDRYPKIPRHIHSITNKHIHARYL
jgi:hypothetical protein